jgi:hypothetical protein
MAVQAKRFRMMSPLSPAPFLVGAHERETLPEGPIRQERLQIISKAQDQKATSMPSRTVRGRSGVT